MGYQCAAYSGPLFQVAIVPAVLASTPRKPPTNACFNGRFGAMAAVAEAALQGKGLDIGKLAGNAVFALPDLQLAHARGVDDHSAIGK